MKKFEEEFSRAYPSFSFLLQYMQEALGAKEVTWKDMTINNLCTIREFLEENYTANYASTLCGIFKAFLARFTDAGLLCGDEYKRALKVKKEPSEQITLSEEEMALIEAYEPETKGEREVKAQFMCEYYSLARSCDINLFTEKNINVNRGIITYVAKKTKKRAIVPLHRNFLKYFHERGGEKSRWFYNHTMKKICRKCGITQEIRAFYRGKEQIMPKCEFVGSHTARRSGATNLAKRGVPIPTIAMMMSHGQDIAMTQRYIWIDEVQLDENGRAFFE